MRNGDELKWSPWRRFPDPRKRGLLVAPFGAGVYQLRRRSTKRIFKIGYGGHVAARMTSLLPAPLGAGRRDNAKLRDYVRRHLKDVEYKTAPCSDPAEARKSEKRLIDGTVGLLFP